MPLPETTTGIRRAVVWCAVVVLCGMHLAFVYFVASSHDPLRPGIAQAKKCAIADCPRTDTEAEWIRTSPDPNGTNRIKLYFCPTHRGMYAWTTMSMGQDASDFGDFLFKAVLFVLFAGLILTGTASPSVAMLERLHPRSVEERQRGLSRGGKSVVVLSSIAVILGLLT